MVNSDVCFSILLLLPFLDVISVFLDTVLLSENLNVLPLQFFSVGLLDIFTICCLDTVPGPPSHM